MLEWKRGGLTQEILDENVVIRGGLGNTPIVCETCRPGSTRMTCWDEVNDWYCVLPEIKTPAVLTKVVLEEWMYTFGISINPMSDVAFRWRPVGGEAVSSWTGWVKTGVTREIEVPNG